MKLAIILCILLTPSLAQAQVSAKAEPPKIEVFVGYSYLHSDFTHQPARFTSYFLDRSISGWNVSISRNLNSWLSIVADVSGHYGSKFDELGFVISQEKGLKPYVYCFLFGPRISARRSNRLIPYVHLLVGEERVRLRFGGFDAVESFKDSGLAIAAGGGLDVRIRDRIAIRALEMDYLWSHLFNQRSLGASRSPKQDNVRISAGVVFRF